MLLLLPPSTIFDSPDLSLVCEIGYKTTDISILFGMEMDWVCIFHLEMDLSYNNWQKNWKNDWVCLWWKNFSCYSLNFPHLQDKRAGDLFQSFLSIFTLFSYVCTTLPISMWGKNWPKSYDSENLVILLNLTLRNLESGSPKKTSQVDVTHLSFN